MVILYSIINPIKDFAKAGYAIPKGMASMERINKILDAENDIVEPREPKTLGGFNDRITFDHVNFHYPDGQRKVLVDLVGDGGLGGEQPLGGSAEIQLLCYGNKALQLVNRHRTAPLLV